jgi:iron complex outermembrane receptor protein
LAIFLAGGNFALAQGQVETPETQDESPETQEETPETQEETPEAQEEETDVEALIRAAEESVEEVDQFEQMKRDLEKGIAESVTVTATRVETDLMTTPVAVTVIDQDTLDREGIRSVEGIARMVPNMDIAVKNGQSTPIISMRGVRSTNETELGDPSVGVHLDGIYSPRMQGILALMFDNERVEIARGPQGTLYGRNSTVGSINIVTAKPELDKFKMRWSAQYGSFDAPELQGMVNVPVTDTFGLRFAGRYYQRDSYIDGYWDPNQWDQRYIGDRVQNAPVIGIDGECTDPRCYTRTQHSNFWAQDPTNPQDIRELVPASQDNFYMNAKEWAYRIGGAWQPKYKDMSWSFSFQHYRSESAGGIDLVNCEKLEGRPNYCRDANENGLCDSGEPQPVEEFDLANYIINSANPVSDCSDLFPKNDTYQAVVNVPGQFNLDIMYLRSQFNWDIKDNLRFVYNAGLEDQDRESAQDMEGSLNAWDQAMFFLPGTGSESWMNEIQLQSYGNEKFNWIAGLNYFQETTSTNGYFDNPISPKSLWDQPDRSTNAGALFAQGTYALSNQWFLTAGYRFSDETREDKGGETFDCTADNSCAEPAVDRQPICPPEFDGDLADCMNAFSREAVNALPTDYFANSAVYADSYANDNKGSWSHNDWRLGLDYQRNENTLLYAYLATGFKAGGIGDVVHGKNLVETGDPNNPFIIEDFVLRSAYDPEEVTTLELGFKQWFLDKKLNLRGAYFYSDYENMQYAAVGTLGFTQEWGRLYDQDGNFVGYGLVDTPIIAYFTDNVPSAEIQGFELEYDWRAWKGGRISGYASWLDTQITEDWILDWGYDPRSYFGLDFEQVFEEPEPVLQANLKGNDLAVSPPFKLNMTVDHAFLIEKWKTTIVPWATIHWEDAAYLTIWNVEKHTDDMDFVIPDSDIRYTDDKREPWSMVHAGVRMYKGNWTAELFAYNLTDEVVQWWGGAAENVAKGSFSMPRNYGFRVGYTY